MPLAQVPLEYFHRLVEKARAQGCDVDQLLVEAGIDPVTWHQGEALSGFAYGQLYQRITRETGDEFFGMFAGGKVPLGAFRLMCLSLLSCRDFFQALVRSGEFAEICRGMKVRFLVERQDGQAVLSLSGIRSLSAVDFERLQAAADPDNIACTLFASYRFHCWLVGRNIPLEQVSLRCGPERVQIDPAAFNAGCVVFHHSASQLVYPEQALDYPIVQSADSTLEFLRTAPYQLIALDASRVSLADQVRTLLNRDVGRSMSSAEEVASRLNVSVPSLRRKLSQEGASFQSLKDQVRLEAALHYLSCPDLTNAEVSEKLGFDEPSAFFRAFKKWTGETPGNYRRRLSTVSG